MPTRREKRGQCPRCGLWGPMPDCQACGEPLEKPKRFRMTKKRIKLVHAVACGRKGIPYEVYKERLQAYGITSSKQMNRETYIQFMRDLRTLPDSEAWKARRQEKRAA